MSKLDPPVEYKDPFGNIITLTESGQIRAYADSQWVGTVVIESESLNNEDTVRSLIERQVQNGHIFSRGVHPPFAAPYFTRLEQLPDESKIWKFVVMRDYLD